MKIGNFEIFTGAFDGIISKKDSIGENEVTTWLGVIDNPTYKIYIILFLRILISKEDVNNVW
jgi:hypothetical protein